MISTFLTITVEALINRALALDPQTADRLKSLAGKTVQIEISGEKHKQLLGTVSFLLTDHGLHWVSPETQKPDVVISGPLKSLFQQMGQSPATGIKVSGDMELGQQLREILRSVDIDWEEQLAKVAGDSVAHSVGTAARKFLNWGKKTTTNLQQDLSSYLREEAHYLPSAVEVDHYIAEVNELRHKMGRLEARWQNYISTTQQ